MFLDVIQALIIVPTRELALQTSQVCIELSKHLKLKVGFIFHYDFSAIGLGNGYHRRYGSSR